MKKRYVIILVFFVFVINAQQTSIMQPAIKNSTLKLDSVYIHVQPIIRSANLLEFFTEKWIAKSYDSDKNPIEFMVYYYDFSSVLQDSIKVTLEHYPINEYKTDFRTSLYSRFHNFEIESFGIFNVFNLKSITEEIVNTNTNEWIPYYYKDGLNDLRLPNATEVNEISYYYDQNFNITDVFKKDATVEPNGYLFEQTVYNWNNVDGFTPNYKFKYENTYNVNNELTESIKKRIDDFTTNVEVNLRKYNYTYAANIFEYTTQTWNESMNDWNIPNKKTILTYNVNNNPVNKSNYDWVNNDWIMYNDGIDDESYDFNNNLFLGYYYEIPTMTDVDYDLFYNSNFLLINEIYSDIGGAGSGNFFGEVIEKEFYYSSDGTNTIDDFNLDNITIYPNPAENIIHLNLDAKVNFKIYSILGKELMNGKTQNTIDVSSLKTGIYFVQFKTENQLISKQLIIK